MTDLQNKLQSNGEAEALALFHKAAQEVPAYKDFLKKNGINHESIDSFQDFQKVPVTDKKNYIDAYSLKELVWAGEIAKNTVINTSSGTTGEPYFWPCSAEEYQLGAEIHEMIYRDSFQIGKYNTLLVICFGMGTWIAGSFTFLCSYLVAEKGYKMTVMTPGFNKEESLKILNQIGPQYDQVIVAGIPTFVKDLIDTWETQPEGKSQIEKIKFLFAAEGFTESWREYILSKVGSKNFESDAISILGSADTAMMGFETVESIKIRRLLSSNTVVRREFFKDERLPSLLSYIPAYRFFETVQNELVITADRSIPLIRYNLHDEGGVISSQEMQSELKKAGFVDQSIDNKLPFVYLFGRGKFTATIYAANIYPENIKEVLIDPSIHTYITGKFSTETKYSSTQDHYLQINVELKPGVKDSEGVDKKITDIFYAKVRKLNTEYDRVCQEYGERAKPVVVLFPNGDPKMFPKDVFKKNS